MTRDSTPRAQLADCWPMRPLLHWLAAAVAAAVAVANASAQGLAWQVPLRGALVYTRTTEQFVVDPPPSRLRQQWLVAGGEDGIFRVWNAQNAQEMFKFEPPKPAGDATAQASAK